jgi:hypothetical protein
VNLGIFQPSASRRRRLVSQLLLLGSFQAAPGAARAEPAVKREGAGAAASQPPAGAAQPPVPAEPETYRTLLGGAYALAPLLARMAGNGAWQLTHSEGAAIAVGLPLLVLPAGVHAYKTDSHRAGKSFALMLASMALGASVMGGSGYMLGDSSCIPEEDAIESCEDRAEDFGFIGLMGGAGIGYVSFAVYDVINNASVPAPPRNGEHGSTASFWLLPLVPEAPERESAGRLGLQLGAALQF